MKILFVSHDSKLYGAPRSLLNLIEGIKKNYPEIKMHALLPYDGLLIEELKKNDVDISIVPFPWSVSGYIKLPLLKQLYRWLKKMRVILTTIPSFVKEVKKINPDLIYTNTSVVTHGYFASKFLNKKHVWHIREFGWEDHGQLYDFGNVIQRFFYNTSNLIIVISNAIKNAKLAHLKVPVTQIYNGVCFAGELNWPAKFITPGKIIKFGIVGGVRKSKGQDEAITAFGTFSKKYPNSQLLIVGGANDAELNALIALAQQCGCSEKVIFTGFTKDVDSVYQQLDVLLSCSRSEGMGRSIVEAMARGIPVISKNAGGAVEIVLQDYNGLIYEDVNDLAQKMEQIIEPQKYSGYSENAINWVKEKFTIEKYVKNVVEAIYEI